MKRSLLFLVLVLWCLGVAAQEKPAIKEKKSISLADKLVGKHRFGVQFIWDGYGTATIKKEGPDLIIEGEQFSKKKKNKKDKAIKDETLDYVKITGVVHMVNKRTLEVTGTLDTFIKSCCGTQSLEGTFIFKKWGKRKYFRLQDPHRGRLCDMYTCHYYIDIFE